MKPVIGTTMEELAGIGAKICIKAWANLTVNKICIPVVNGNLTAMGDFPRLPAPVCQDSYLRRSGCCDQNVIREADRYRKEHLGGYLNDVSEKSHENNGRQ